METEAIQFIVESSYKW